MVLPSFSVEVFVVKTILPKSEGHDSFKWPSYLKTVNAIRDYPN